MCRNNMDIEFAAVQSLELALEYSEEAEKGKEREHRKLIHKEKKKKKTERENWHKIAWAGQVKVGHLLNEQTYSEK